MASRVMHEARAFGMSDGFTVPVYGFDGYQACVTMGGETCDLSPDALNALHIVSLIAYSRAREIVNVGPGYDEDVSELTERELDVLKWVSVGKSNWDISVILSISEKTVEKHLSAISSKLNALNRTHAVAYALRTGLIN